MGRTRAISFRSWRTRARFSRPTRSGARASAGPFRHGASSTCSPAQAPPEPDAGAPLEAAPAIPPEAANEDAAKAESAFTPEAEKPAAKPSVKERPRRVLSIKGGVLVGQDGKYVQYRKKCEKCGYMDQGKCNQLIRPGSMKISFFCRKCRKGRMVEMMAVG